MNINKIKEGLEQILKNINLKNIGDYYRFLQKINTNNPLFDRINTTIILIDKKMKDDKNYDASDDLDKVRNLLLESGLTEEEIDYEELNPSFLFKKELVHNYTILNIGNILENN